MKQIVGGLENNQKGLLDNTTIKNVFDLLDDARNQLDKLSAYKIIYKQIEPTTDLVKI
jgi:hypothetical protein